MSKENLISKLLKDYDSALNHSGVNGERLGQRLAMLSEIGATAEGGVNRPGFSAEEKQAKEQVKVWMKDAGLKVWEDGAGNVFGRLSGLADSMPAVASGSHVDSVPNGGNFDGPLGVLAALEVVEAWKETGHRPQRPFEVVIFSDEEGARFNGSLTGSMSLMGTLDIEKQLQLTDFNGDSFEEVLEKYGTSLDELKKASSHKKDIGLFIEVHIEQGKRLEKAGLPVGIVSGIAGPCWLEIIFSGKAGHAGNTPMDDRKDALVAAGEFVVAVETFPEKVSSTAVATVGKLSVHPNGVNVIPGEVSLFADIRDIYENTRDELVSLVIEKAKSIAEKRGIEVSIKVNTSVKPVPIDENIQTKLEKAFLENQIEPMRLPSGAGHDSMIVGEEIPVGMIFVRSKDGISHNPKEWSSLNDCVISVHVLKSFIESL
ncbi:M20 family metallo-hydrolase [Neobacillus citreus]|uniref:M20 family metallo-hydrolase n=1 Tax=Neobacillus citreus TaxID=2833578 RepID=A0A942YBH2_9BACI|nr:M20 family metallo-hydrolase [Neobacillus citreus]MCH6264276.1 M20 family metallo-hydrolase [Neobacillus citreus]